jgi:hypothetical protein
MVINKISGRILFRALLAFAAVNGICSAKGQMINIYAAPNGVDTGNGTSLSNAVSLTRAVLVAKNYKNDSCTVWLSDGTYNQLVLDSTSTRTAAAPVIYQSINIKKAVFQPLITINQNNFQALPDSITNRIIDSTAKIKVVQLPLASLNLKSMGVWPNTFGVASMTTPRFYNNGSELPMSRYPKDSNMTMGKVLENGVGGKYPGGTFEYKNDRCKFWLQEINDAGLFLEGAWRVGWEIDILKTQDIDTTADTLQQVEGVSGGIGDKYTRPYGNNAEPYWAINLVEEISMPGEWSINFRTKMLYIWPPDSANIQVASDPTQPAINATNCAETYFKNITIMGGAGDGFTLTNCSGIGIMGCDISNCSGNGITITGGKNCSVLSNDIHYIGGSGVKIASASYASDQKNVVLCNHKVVNNHLYTIGQEKLVYYPPVDISTAIGSYVGYNLMNDAPQICVYFGGNSNVIEFNEMCNVGNKFGGASEIYRTGNFADRGNIVRYNYLHESPFGGGISEDNNGTGDSIYNNIIANMMLGTNNNGGYQDVFTSNIYVDNVPAHGSGITNDTTKTYISDYNNLATIYNGSAAYRAAYPNATAILDTVGGTNRAYGSLLWDQFTCNVLISNSQAFGGIKDTAFFNTDGSQKASAMLPTAAAFKQYGTIVHDNIKMNGALLNPIVPFSIDSLKKVYAFDKTCGENWHINRIGLFKDSYRTILDTLATQGVSPTFFWEKDSINGDSCAVTIKIANPNIVNGISSIQYYLDGNVAAPISLVADTISYDTVAYTAVFGGLPAGNHSVTVTIYDSTLWQYISGIDTFTIAEGLPVQIITFTGKADGNYANLSWTTANEINIKEYQVEQSTDGINFKTIGSVAAKGAGTGRNVYGFMANQQGINSAYYRLKIVENSINGGYSKVVELKNGISSSEGLTIFPNPAKEKVSVIYTSDVAISNAHIIIEDVTGRKVIDWDYSIYQGNNTITIPLGNVAKGIYLIKLISNGILVSEGKIIVMR